MKPSVSRLAERESRFEDRRRNAETEASNIPLETLDAESLEGMLAQIVELHSAKPVRLQWDEKYSQTHEQNRPATGPSAHTEAYGDHEPPVETVISFELRIPCRGAVAALMEVPDRSISSLSSYGDLSEISIATLVDFDQPWSAEDLRKLVDAWIDRLRQTVAQANAAIEQARLDLRMATHAVLEPRWTRNRRLRDAVRELAIPLEKTTTTQVAIPVRPAAVTMKQTDDSPAKAAPEWSLAADIANAVMDTIAGFSRALERSPTSAARLLGDDEESMRDVLLFILNANYRGLVTGETFIGKGKADVLLRWEDRDAFLAECKIWKGPKAFGDGVTQLLERYTLWRHTQVAMILFIREVSDATAVIESARQALTRHDRTLGVLPSDEPSARSDFNVVGSGDERRPVTLSLIPVVIPRPVEA